MNLTTVNTQRSLGVLHHIFLIVVGMTTCMQEAPPLDMRDAANVSACYANHRPARAPTDTQQLPMALRGIVYTAEPIWLLGRGFSQMRRHSASFRPMQVVGQASTSPLATRRSTLPKGQWTLPTT